jgi:hypothetical protein
MFNDYFSQAVIDVLLGNVSAKVFEDFETNMMSADPGISIEKIREQAIETCRKIVIQAPDEDLISAWPVLTPAQPNTLRTLPFEESVLLLTDAARYGCKFDWSTEKVLAFEKVDLRAITSLHYVNVHRTAKRRRGQCGNRDYVHSWQRERHASQHTFTSKFRERGYNDTKAGQGRTITWDSLLARLSSTIVAHHGAEAHIK